MLDKGKITSIQLALLIITVIASTSVLFLPSVIVQEAGRDSWIFIFPLAFGLAAAYLCVSLGLCFEDKSIIVYANEIMGKYIGSFIAALYIFFFIWLNTLVVRQFSIFINTAFMPETPELTFKIIIILLAAYAVKNGIEVITRSNQFMFPIFVIFYSLIIFFSLSEIDFTNFLPVLENGIKPVIKGSIAPASWIAEIILLLVLIPNINQPSELKKNSVYIIVVIVIIFVSDIIVTVGVLGANLTSHLVFPFLSLSRYSRATMVLERIETLVMLLWVAPVMVKVTAIHYCASISCAQFFNLSDYKSLVMPLGILTIVWSIILADNSRELVFIIDKIMPYYIFILALPIPALLLIIHKIKQKRSSKA